MSRSKSKTRISRGSEGFVGKDDAYLSILGPAYHDMPICRGLDLAYWEVQMRPQAYLWADAAQSGVPN